MNRSRRFFFSPFFLVLLGLGVPLLLLLLIELTLTIPPVTEYLIRNHYFPPASPDILRSRDLAGRMHRVGLSCEGRPTVADQKKLDTGVVDELDIQQVPFQALFANPGKEFSFETSVRTKREKVTILKNKVGVNKFGQRRVTGFHPKGKSQILFLGDSYTFGIGVEDSETFASLLQKGFPETSVYNMGVPGFSPSFILHELEKRPQRYQMPRQNGVAFYLFLPDHMERVVGRLQRVNQDPGSADWPWYGMDGRGEAVLRGKLSDKWTYPLYHALARLNLVKFFRLNWPPAFSQEDFETVASILAKARFQLFERTGVPQLVTVLFPTESSVNEGMKEALEQFHLPYLDLTRIDLNVATDGRPLYADEHPTACTHYVLA
ncbi:MAG TPA: hypothetical protein VIH99_00230, partial [Bdellovibrionota bacterium]